MERLVAVPRNSLVSRTLAACRNGALSRKKENFAPEDEPAAGASAGLQAVDELHVSMPRVLSWFDLICFGVGGIIGAGVYILSGKVAAQAAGPSVVLSFVVAGVFCIFSGLCYAEFGARAAGAKGAAGSAYSYAYLSLGEFTAWTIGWDLVLEYTVGTAAIAKGWSYYFVDLIDTFGAALPKWLQEGAPIGNPKYGNANLLAALLVLALTCLLCFGIKESAWFSNFIVCTKIVTLLIVVGAGLGLVQSSNFEPFVPPEFGVQGVFNGAAIVFFAYIGFDSVSVVAEEARRPSRDIPLGIMGSLLLCTALYVVVVLTMVGMVKYTAIDTRAPLVAVFRTHNMKWAQVVVGIGAVSGLTSTCLSTMMPQSRIFLAMSRDGLLPPVFGKVSRRWGTPVWGTLIVGVLCAALAGLVEMDVLSDAVSIGTLFAFSVVCTGVLILRYQKPGQEPLRDALALYALLLLFCFTAGNPAAPVALRAALGALSGGAAALVAWRLWRLEQVPVHAKFVCPLVPLVPILGVLGNLYLMTRVGAEAWARLIVWFALGLLIYFSYSLHGSRLAGAGAPPAPRPLPELELELAEGSGAAAAPEEAAAGEAEPAARAPGGGGRALPSKAEGRGGPRAGSSGSERGGASARGGDFELASPAATRDLHQRSTSGGGGGPHCDRAGGLGPPPASLPELQQGSGEQAPDSVSPQGQAGPQAPTPAHAQDYNPFLE